METNQILHSVCRSKYFRVLLLIGHCCLNLGYDVALYKKDLIDVLLNFNHFLSHHLNALRESSSRGLISMDVALDLTAYFFEIQCQTVFNFA
jgi:hypothetical protein